MIQLTRKLSEAKIYVVFLEDQTIEDIDKLESVESSTDDLVDLDSLDPPIFMILMRKCRHLMMMPRKMMLSQRLRGSSHYHRHR